MNKIYRNPQIILRTKKTASMRDHRGGKVIYTTNAIESLNSGHRRLNRGRSIFPESKALQKTLYLATHELTKKWTNIMRDWGKVYAELSIMYPDWLS